MCALMNVKEVELIGMPKLKKCVLMGGLKNVKSVKMENAGKFESVKGLKEVMEAERKKKEVERKRREEEEKKRREMEERRKKAEEEKKKREEEERKRREEIERRRKEEEERKRGEEEEGKKREEEERKRREEEERKKRELEERRKKELEERRKREEKERKKRKEMMALARTTVIVRNVEDMKNTNSYVGVIAIANNCCNERELSMLDLSRFVNLRELKMGDECFQYVKEVKFIGLSQLESVVIGKNCFRQCKKVWADFADPNHHFYLKNCERVRELKIDCFSFFNYSVCEIENVPSLEVIEMGELDEAKASFHNASLELKSDCDEVK